MSLVGCSDFIINGGTFTNINNFIAEEKRRRTIWDDYNRVKPGDVRLEQNICTTEVRRKYRCKDEEGRKEYYLWRDIDARRNIGIARIRGEDREDKFLYITYSGPDAFTAFKQDFNRFARIKNANVAQMFGYNDNERGLPALIFYDALIPLGRIITKGQQLAPLLFSYFSHLYGRMRGEIPVGRLLLGELWVDARTGALQEGPYVELPFFKSWVMVGTNNNTIPNAHFTHLPIQTYTDTDTIFKYLTKMFTPRTILTGIRWSYQGFTQALDDEQVIPVLSYLPGAIYNRCSRDIIARLPGTRERWCYEFRRVGNGIPDEMRESQVVMDNGLVRFTVASTGIKELQGIGSQYLLNPAGECMVLADSWFAQAHSVFSQLGSQEDNWEDYAILSGIVLRLRRTSLHKEPVIPLDVYLFIRPVPRPSDDEAVWRSWAETEKYFWSYDPLGQEMVSERLQESLGLPSFTSTISALHQNWSSGPYGAIQKFHIFKGFNPAMTDFAVSLDLPILEVIGDSNRFEDLGESSFQALV